MGLAIRNVFDDLPQPERIEEVLAGPEAVERKSPRLVRQRAGESELRVTHKKMNTRHPEQGAHLSLLGQVE
jgi:hypothetical protein